MDPPNFPFSPINPKGDPDSVFDLNWSDDDSSFIFLDDDDTSTFDTSTSDLSDLSNLSAEGKEAAMELISLIEPGKSVDSDQVQDSAIEFAQESIEDEEQEQYVMIVLEPPSMQDPLLKDFMTVASAYEEMGFFHYFQRMFIGAFLYNPSSGIRENSH